MKKYIYFIIGLAIFLRFFPSLYPDPIKGLDQDPNTGLTCTVYSRLRHFFLFSSTGLVKFWFGGHFIALGQGISKLLFNFFSEMYISRIFWLQSLWNWVEIDKYFFKYSRVTYQKTRIGTLNKNIESNLHMSEYVRLTCEKPCFLENFRT